MVARPEDPHRLWEELANTGAVQGQKLGEVTPRQPEKIEVEMRKPQLPESMTSILAQASRTEIAADPPLNADGVKSPANTISRGTVLNGRVSTDIYWQQSRYRNENERESEQFFIVIDEPLKNKFSRPIVETGSVLVVTIEPRTSQGGLVRLVAELLILPDGTEVSLPEGAMAIRGEYQKPLVAELRTIGGGDEGFDLEPALDALTILGDIGNVDGASTAATLIRRMNTRNRSYRGYGQTSSFWMLPGGTPVTIRVQQNIRASSENEVLELDLSALEGIEIFSPDAKRQVSPADEE